MFPLLSSGSVNSNSSTFLLFFPPKERVLLFTNLWFARFDRPQFNPLTPISQFVCRSPFVLFSYPSEIALLLPHLASAPTDQKE